MRFRIRWPRGLDGSFFRQVVIITIGVLVALALEQVASGIRERQRVSDILSAMNEELAAANLVFQIRLRASPCIDSKLDAIEAILNDRQSSGPWRDVGRPPFFFASDGAWNSEVADLLARHIGPARFRSYGLAYRGLQQFSEAARAEQAQWVILQTLEQQDEPIAGDRRWRLVEASGAARNSALLLKAIAEQMIDQLQTLGLEAPEGPEAISQEEMQARPLCQPLTHGE